MIRHEYCPQWRHGSRLRVIPGWVDPAIVISPDRDWLERMFTLPSRHRDAPMVHRVGFAVCGDGLTLFLERAPASSNECALIEDLQLATTSEPLFVGSLSRNGDAVEAAVRMFERRRSSPTDRNRVTVGLPTDLDTLVVDPTAHLSALVDDLRNQRAKAGYEVWFELEPTHLGTCPCAMEDPVVEAELHDFEPVDLHALYGV